MPSPLSLEDTAARLRLANQLLDVERVEGHPNPLGRRGRVRDELDESVASDGVFDRTEYLVRDVELRECAQLVDDIGATNARRGGVPQRQRGDAVRVQEVWRRFQLGEP